MTTLDILARMTLTVIVVAALLGAGATLANNLSRLPRVPRRRPRPRTLAAGDAPLRRETRR